MKNCLKTNFFIILFLGLPLWLYVLAEVSFMTGLNPFIKEVQAAIDAGDCFLLPDK